MGAARTLIALGDSITVGRGEPLDGVPCRPWVDWLGDALASDVGNLAREGVGVASVLADQVPRVGRGHALGCLYVGVNDVRDPGWDRDAYARGLAEITAALAPCCDRLLLCTIPTDLGRPRAGARKVGEANAEIRAQAARHAARLCRLDDLAGPPLLLEDAVHPTALGQREIARRALAASGMLRR